MPLPELSLGPMSGNLRNMKFDHLRLLEERGVERTEVVANHLPLVVLVCLFSDDV